MSCCATPARKGRGQRESAVLPGLARTVAIASTAAGVGNRLVGILHGCLARRVFYQEQLAWPAAKLATWFEERGCRGVQPPGVLAT